jgi:hypothetical protein
MAVRLRPQTYVCVGVGGGGGGALAVVLLLVDSQRLKLSCPSLSELSAVLFPKWRCCFQAAPGWEAALWLLGPFHDKASPCAR